MSTNGRAVIIGAGPAGLTAAHELAEAGRPAIVFEMDDQVGGIARTATYKGYRFDIGGHRFFTKVARVNELWHEIMGDDFLVRPRLSRIYYRDRFFEYPLKPMNALAGLGPIEAVRILASYARARAFPSDEERSLEQWVVNRFGRRLFEIFFKTYTEKVWGIPCSEIGADWAAQRIKNLDLKTAVRNALLGSSSDGGRIITTLIDRFEYPRLGPGMLWERWCERLAGQGVPTVLEAEVVRLRHADGRVLEATVRHRSGKVEVVEGSDFISTMPVQALIRALDPPPPAGVLEAADQLRYRDFLTVVLIVEDAELFPDNWIYIHSPDVKVGRIQNFKNWSPEMVPDPATTSLGLEYFVQEGDELWSSPDAELVELGTRETARLGLVQPDRVRDGTVVRMPKAYPVYDSHYQSALKTIRAWTSGLENLHLIGRNGQHRYNNQDHSMVTGILAARNVLGESHDVWEVNVEEDYHEAGEVRDRLTPSKAPAETLEDLLRAAFARYDPLALGAATGIVAGCGLFLATAWVLLLHNADQGYVLSLLGHYLLGYAVTWEGAVSGLIEGALGGFIFGYLLARMVNLLVAWHEGLLQRELQVAGTLDPLDMESP